MPEQVPIDRDAQEAMKARIRETLAANPAYAEVREALEALGFRAKEDRPALALWENGEHELLVLVHIDPKTGRLRDHMVSTFEETEGFE
ncbi:MULTISPECIES: hypothetical protein [Methanoculleus]|uniref:Uncharacterized protein n=2 Tax=Methanoculleus TaxID=45989 RepID=A3CWE4_METMJ|nr:MULTISPECIES: hypothetical protein [Methanoculleus]ABN57694.1 hypothetical protein Memar_1768 [Methanoculleus marisnigri JR1]MCC7556790.1 hypothetical protein [Methanoculleus marisnigri]UYU19086.1 hypothetical protein OH143_03055 [Methanoculleus submarinus]